MTNPIIPFPPRFWRNKPGREYILLALLFVFTLAIRLVLITQKNLWFDEIYSWHLSRQPFISIIFTTWSDIHPPLFYFILKGWIWIFGESVISLRILPVLCSSLSIILIYPVSRKILNEQNSLIVLILYSLSPLNLFYSQEVRMASVNLFFNLASSYYFFRMMTPSTAWKKIEFLYILFTILSLYTHYFSVFILLAQILYVIYLRKKDKLDIKIFLKSYLIIFLVYLIWIPVMAIQISRGQPWRYEQDIGEVLYQVKAFIIDMAVGFYQRYSDLIFVNNLFLVLCSLLLLAVIGFYWNYITNNSYAKNRDTNLNSPPPAKKAVVLIFLLFFVPLLFAVIVSFKQWIEYFRYLSIVIPFFLILLVYGFTAYKFVLRISFVCIFLLINLYGIYLYFENNSKNNDYREVMEYIGNSKDANNKIFVYPFYYGWVLDYYKVIGEYPQINHQDYGWEFHGIIDSVKSQNIGKFWFILDYHSFDTATYKEKLNLLMENENLKKERTFFIQPQKVELYSVSKK